MKKIKNIFNSIVKIGLIICLVAVSYNFDKIKATRALFFDKAEIQGLVLSAGFWIPGLSLEVSPEEPDGKNDFYKTTPCVSLFADINREEDGIEIYYEFSDDGDPMDDGEKYQGECIEVPDGNPTYFQVQAVNEENDDWTSEVINQEFKIDTVAPVVKITSPKEGEIFGEIEIRGSVEDDNPSHYWLVVEDENGKKVAGPGVVEEKQVFEDKKFFVWDTTEVEDGEYRIKLEARDLAGNKTPDQSPVLSDPNDENDSVDWVRVEVDNSIVDNDYQPQPGDVVINEVMWMGSDLDSEDEWIELRNMTDQDIDLSNWNIENGTRGNGHIEIPHGYSIKANRYFLIFKKKWDETAVGLIKDLEKNEGMTNKSGMDILDDGEKLELVSKSKEVIDITWKDGENWPTGLQGDDEHRSMERNFEPGAGEILENWHSCLVDGCNSEDFWREEDGNNYGTPGGDNSSEVKDE